MNFHRRNRNPNLYVLPYSRFENSKKKEKETFHFRNNVLPYKGNYSVNVLVFEFVEKELGFEKNGPKKMVIFYFYFFRCKLVKLGKLG